MKQAHRFFPDITASLGVFVIALPLCVGIAVASGADPAAGIIGGIIGGLIIGLFSGAPLVVSGPAAGLVTIVFDYIQKYGFEGLLIITIMAGSLQILFGVFRIGGIFNLAPSGLLKGMLAAIGALIILSQVHVLFANESTSSLYESIFLLPTSINKLFLDSTVLPIFLIGIIAILLQVYWIKICTWLNLKKLIIIPAVIPTIVIATLCSLIFVMPRIDVSPISSFAHQSMIQVIDSGSWEVLYMFFIPALVLAIIMSAETLLTAKAIDQLTQKNCNLNRELTAQGIGNMTSGMFGGLPLSGVIVRASANINFGAKTRLSTILHGLWLLLFVGLVPFLLELIPMSALAGILIYTGFKLLNIPQLIQLFQVSREQFAVWVFTFKGIIFTNLLSGLIIGLALYLSIKIFHKIQGLIKNKRAEVVSHKSLSNKNL